MEHREVYPWGSVSFWTDGVASEASKAKEARFEIGHGINVERITIDAYSSTVEKLIRGLNATLASGIYKGKAEVRAALGIK